MSLVGLDLNATRARAVIGPAGIPPKDLPLEESRRDLPAILSLQGRYPEAGRAGVALCRQLPHLVCENIFSRLGTPHQWIAGRHRLDAARALGVVLERIRTQSGAGVGDAPRWKAFETGSAKDHSVSKQGIEQDLGTGSGIV